MVWSVCSHLAVLPVSITSSQFAPPLQDAEVLQTPGIMCGHCNLAEKLFSMGKSGSKPLLLIQTRLLDLHITNKVPYISFGPFEKWNHPSLFCLRLHWVVLICSLSACPWWELVCTKGYLSSCNPQDRDATEACASSILQRGYRAAFHCSPGQSNSDIKAELNF